MTRGQGKFLFREGKPGCLWEVKCLFGMCPHSTQTVFLTPPTPLLKPCSCVIIILLQCSALYGTRSPLPPVHMGESPPVLEEKLLEDRASFDRFTLVSPAWHNVWQT